MGCINTTEVNKIHPKRSRERFHEFGLNKQNSSELYDQNKPNGLISRHIERKIIQRNSLQNISSMRDTEHNTVAQTHDKRTSINTMSVAVLDKLVANHNDSKPRFSNSNFCLPNFPNIIADDYDLNGNADKNLEEEIKA